MATRIQELPKRLPGDVTPRSYRGPIYRLGAIAAALGALVTPISVGVFIAFPPPDYDQGAGKWFAHIQDNRLLGLMSLDLPFLIISVLMIFVMLALFIGLIRVRPIAAIVGGVLYVVAVATYFGTNTSFELLSLSDRWAEAATAAERVPLLGAGEALLGAFNGTAFHVNYILAQTAGIILGLALLRVGLLGRTVAYLMILGNAFGFLLYVPRIGLALSAFSGVILWMWMIFLSRRLLQLARQQDLGASLSGEAI
jgi:hypothetical protein